MLLLKHHDEYGDKTLEIVPRKARPARDTYLWYKAHRRLMLRLSREKGRPERCGLHPDARCTEGWDRPD